MKHLMMAVGLTLGLAGCQSCNETPEAPLPIPQEGRLPAAPKPAPTLATPVAPPPSCVVVADSDFEQGPAPLEIHFTTEGMCTDAEGEPTWDFGDGSPPSHEPSPVHVYSRPGTYQVKLKLVDSVNGVQDNDETEITVTAAGPTE